MLQELEMAGPPLVVVSTEPFNAETRLNAQLGVITPTPAFYVRDHFAMPRIDRAQWRLTLDGDVARPLTLRYDELRALPSRTLLVTLECAGNGRTGLYPPAEGQPFGYGVVSTAEWTGVPLQTVLEAAGLLPTARDVLFVGADSGPNPEAGGVTMAFERSVQQPHQHEGIDHRRIGALAEVRRHGVRRVPEQEAATTPPAPHGHLAQVGGPL